MHSDYNKSVHDEYITFAIIFEGNMNLHYKWAEAKLVENWKNFPKFF